MPQVTLHLTDSAYQWVNQIAKTTGQSIETVLQKNRLHWYGDNRSNSLWMSDRHHLETEQPLSPHSSP